MGLARRDLGRRMVLVREVWKLVEQLEPKNQEIFRLRAKGATFEEMAVALSMQGGTIRKRHRRITQWLSTELNRLGHTA